MRKLTDMSHGYVAPQTANKSVSASSKQIDFELLMNEPHHKDYRSKPKGVDGNSVETRRIDLRQKTENETNSNSINKDQPSLESLLKNLLNTMSSNERPVNVVMDNHVDESSTEEEDEEEEVDSNDLWIERYRKQKERSLQKQESES